MNDEPKIAMFGNIPVEVVCGIAKVFEKAFPGSIACNGPPAAAEGFPGATIVFLPAGNAGPVAERTGL
jgi:hypothetical protein